MSRGSLGSAGACTCTLRLESRRAQARWPSSGGMTQTQGSGRRRVWARFRWNWGCSTALRHTRGGGSTPDTQRSEQREGSLGERGWRRQRMGQAARRGLACEARSRVQTRKRLPPNAIRTARSRVPLCLRQAGTCPSAQPAVFSPNLAAPPVRRSLSGHRVRARTATAAAGPPGPRPWCARCSRRLRGRPARGRHTKTR